MMWWWKKKPAAAPKSFLSVSDMPPRELLELVRDPEMTYKLELAKRRGELGVLSRATRDIDPRTASVEALDAALVECSLWHATYPETDDWELVSWLEAVCKDELLARALAKISGGRRPLWVPCPYP